MTHGAARPRAHEQRVPVAVCLDMHQFEKVAGSLAFLPQPLLAAAEEHDTAARQLPGWDRSPGTDGYQVAPDSNAGASGLDGEGARDVAVRYAEAPMEH